MGSTRGPFHDAFAAGVFGEEGGGGTAPPGVGVEGGGEGLGQEIQGVAAPILKADYTQ